MGTVFHGCCHSELRAKKNVGCCAPESPTVWVQVLGGTNRLPASCQPPANHLPTTCRPADNHLLASCQPAGSAPCWLQTMACAGPAARQQLPPTVPHPTTNCHPPYHTAPAAPARLCRCRVGGTTAYWSAWAACATAGGVEPGGRRAWAAPTTRAGPTRSRGWRRSAWCRCVGRARSKQDPDPLGPGRAAGLTRSRRYGLDPGSWIEAS